MKNSIFEAKQATSRECITYRFQPIDQFDAIKEAIVKKCNSKRKLSISPSIQEEENEQKKGSSPIHLQHHIGGLPSPPVEEKKVIAILPSSPTSLSTSSKQQKPLLLSSQEIREKIQHLKDEKHRLFQLIKQMMIDEENKKRKAKAEELEINKKQPLQQPPQLTPATPPAQQTKKKSRWGAPAIDTPPFYNSYNNQSSYFYPRPTSSSRYNPSHLYSNQQRSRPQQHYPLSRPPYSR